MQAGEIDAGAVGVMLQSGGLLRDLSVRELVTMVASLYPHPLPVDHVLDVTGLHGIAERRTQKLSGGETQRARFAMALLTGPSSKVSAVHARHRDQMAGLENP